MLSKFLAYPSTVFIYCARIMPGECKPYTKVVGYRINQLKTNQNNISASPCTLHHKLIRVDVDNPENKFVSCKSKENCKHLIFV